MCVCVCGGGGVLMRDKNFENIRTKLKLKA